MTEEAAAEAVRDALPTAAKVMVEFPEQAMAGESATAEIVVAPFEIIVAVLFVIEIGDEEAIEAE
jgi:hypothetical protein